MTARGFFFERGKPRLFGFYHPPLSGESAEGATAGTAAPWRDAVVVLCQPLGHEYYRCHRAMRLLAEQLSAAGFPVLRFDYYGCGDSAGEPAACDLRQWTRDIAGAMREARAQSGRGSVALVGLRLGATLAALAAEGPESPHSVLLWQPVRSGADYLDELEGIHRELARDLPGRRTSPCAAEPDGATDLIGFPYSRQLLDDIAGVTLGKVRLAGVTRVAILETPDSQPPEHAPLDDRADRLTTSGPAIWRERASRALDGALVPKAPLSAIAGWLSEVYA